jgi:pimeloyl-ACP methyl ester carboxylesterase
MMNVAPHYAELRDAALCYEAVGTGVPVVFLHGFSFDLRMWDDQVAALSGRYQVVPVRIERVWEIGAWND